MPKGAEHWSAQTYHFNAEEAPPVRTGFYEVTTDAFPNARGLIWFDVEHKAWFDDSLALAGVTARQVWWRGVTESLGRSRRTLL